LGLRQSKECKMHLLKYRRIAEYIHSCTQEKLKKNAGEINFLHPNAGPALARGPRSRTLTHSHTHTNTGAMSALGIGGDGGAGSSAAHEPRAPPPPLLDNHGHYGL
jgi:hypothetical protein